MLVYGAEWKAVCPCLESIPIQPEAEVTSKSNEENIFPMMIAAFEPLGYDACFLLFHPCLPPKADRPFLAVRFAGRAF
jgi:hypothetical protein